MSIISKIKNSRLFKFDSTISRFELLETELSEPSIYSNKTDPSRISSSAVGAGEKAEGLLPSKLTDALALLRENFRTDINKDYIVREFSLGGNHACAIMFINGMVDVETINNFILKSGMNAIVPEDTESLYSYAMKNVFAVNEAVAENKLKEIKRAILVGQTAVMIDGEEKAILLDTRKYPQRSIETPENEKSVFGPRECFIENLRTNMTLIRRHIKVDDLVCEMRAVGTGNANSVGIVYRETIANPRLVEEVKARIAKVNVRTVLSMGTLEQLTENSTYSPMRQMLLTERPDRCASFLMDGHVVLIVDGSPLAAILPVTLFALMSTSEDSYARQPIGMLMRIVRYAGALISILVPGLFTAIVMHHQGFLSAEVLTTLIASRKLVFIPIGAEMLFLLLVFQLVREAGMRVPGSIGQAIGIIGGLVLGQAAVAANLASSVVLIIVALTGLGNFCVPDYSTQICTVYFRVGLVILGWMGGFLGFSCGLLILFTYLSSLKSFGVPFLSPFSPKTYSRRLSVLRGKITAPLVSDEDYMN